MRMGSLIIKLIWFSLTASYTLKFYMIRDSCSADRYNSYKLFGAIDQFKWKQPSQFCQVLHPSTSGELGSSVLLQSTARNICTNL